MPKIIQFQYDNGILFILDDTGNLYGNMDLRSEHGWKPITGPVSYPGQSLPDEGADMNGQETKQLSQTVAQISASLAQLVEIQQKRLEVENQMAINADSVNQILDILNTVLDKDATDVAAKEEAQAQWQALKDRDAGLDDPALQAKLEQVMAKAASATPGDQSGQTANLSSR